MILLALPISSMRDSGVVITMLEYIYYRIPKRRPNFWPRGRLSYVTTSNH